MRFPLKKLATLCTKIGSGVTPRGGDSVYVESGTSLIRSQNVYNSRFQFSGLAHITDKQADQMRGVAVAEEDVLLNITGDSVARACLAPARALPARVNQHVAIIRTSKGELRPRFLAYYLVTPQMQSQMLSLAGSGGTRKALTKAMIEVFTVPVPSPAIQDRIVGVLLNYDNLIENNRRRIKLLEESARLIYREWFVHLRFPGYEHIKIENGIPEGWRRIPLGQFAPLSYGKALKDENRVPGPFPVYGSSGEVGSHDTALVIGPGIVVGRKGNVGAIYWSDGNFYPIDTTYFIGADRASLFLYHALQSVPFLNTDLAVPGLNRDVAHSREILIPTKAILQEFEALASNFYRQIRLLKTQTTRLTEARDLLLPRLMSGEIEV